MTSVVQICNMALARIGTGRIDSLTEASEEARQCSTFYEPVRDRLLARVPWRFALKREALAPLSVTAPVEWTYTYAWPSDCIQARYIEPTGPTPSSAGLIWPDQWYWNQVDPGGSVVTELPAMRTPSFERRGDTIVTHQPEAVLIYTYRVTDPNQFDPLFVEALSYALAAELAVPIRDDKAGRREMERAAHSALMVAAAGTGRDGSANINRDADWILARG